MLFNSYVFILFFSPVVICVYFFLNKLKWYRAAIFFLFFISLFFYGYWNPIYLPLILISILINYFIGASFNHLFAINWLNRKFLLLVGIIFNVALLAYFKYSNFFMSNLNYFLNNNFQLLKIILPLGISFFTFTQIAFLIDAYQGRVKEYNLINYGLFVTFFPHLLAGPIIHHTEMMPQFSDTANKAINYKNLVIGLMVFSIGLFKKSCIADTLAEWVNNDYMRYEYLSTFEAWFLSFCYTFQLYFDFSGYTDMAIGCSLMLNIKLPENFNSPYQALNIQDFWRRWHMTLSRWLRDYIYIPLGGNRAGEIAIHCNLIVTFLIGGFWHGAGWTYVIWGLLHGMAISIHRLWKKMNIQLPKIIAWMITFLFVNFAWIFFRAESLSQAFTILNKMFQPIKVELPSSIKELSYTDIIPDLMMSYKEFFLLFSFFMFICFTTKNSIALKSAYTGTLRWNVFISVTLVLGILSLTRVTTFIYFQF